MTDKIKRYVEQQFISKDFFSQQLLLLFDEICSKLRKAHGAHFNSWISITPVFVCRTTWEAKKTSKWLEIPISNSHLFQYASNGDLFIQYL